jgi:hypothetical protein
MKILKEDYSENNKLPLHQRKIVVRELPSHDKNHFLIRSCILKQRKQSRFVHSKPHHPISRLF